MTSDATGAPDEAGPDPASAAVPPSAPGGRIPIAQRAARRRYLEQRGYDSPTGLLEFLREGRDASVVRRSRWDLVFHPVARKLVLLAVAAGIVYLLVSFVVGQVRDVRIDTWSGPGAAVTSGMRLDGCPTFHRTDDPVFPNWIRMDGKVYQPTGAQLPIGRSNIGVYYVDSGYTFDSLRIYRVTLEGLGAPGTRILVRTGEAPAGGLFGAIPDCS